MSREGRSAKDTALIERYYSKDPHYPCPCYEEGSRWCSACLKSVRVAATRQGTRERIKEILDEVVLAPCFTEWDCAVSFGIGGWEALCERIMDAV